MEMRAQSVTTVRGLVRERGIRLPSCHTEKFANQVRAAKLDDAVFRIIEPRLAVVEQIDVELAKAEAQLAELCAQEPVIALLTTAPGVGVLVAAAVVSVLDDDSRLKPTQAAPKSVKRWRAPRSVGG